MWDREDVSLLAVAPMCLLLAESWMTASASCADRTSREDKFSTKTPLPPGLRSSRMRRFAPAADSTGGEVASIGDAEASELPIGFGAITAVDVFGVNRSISCSL